MASGVITLPDEFIPKLVEQLSEYGEKAFVMTKNIRLSLSLKRKLSVYIDAWPEFTTVLVKITMPELLNEPLPLFTTDVLKCRNFLLLNDNFNWPYGIYRVVGSEALSVLSEVVLEKGINHRIGPNLHLFHVRNDWLPTTGFSLPSQYQEGVLLSSDVATVVDEWTYAIMDAEDYVKYLIDNFPSVCIRDDKGILVGWFLQHTFGTLGILHVKDAHRHRGLAKYMVRKLSEKILENNQYAYVNIPETNDVSRKLHERCGFRITGATSKIIYILGRDSGKYNFPTDKQNIMK